MNAAVLSDLKVWVQGFPHTDPEHERRARVENQLLAEILVAARSLIRDEAHFCKKAWAIDKAGHPWDVRSITMMSRFDACQFCGEGAIYWAAFWTGLSDWERLADKACDLLGSLIGTSLYRWIDEDTTTHAQALALFTEGVQRALGQPR